MEYSSILPKLTVLLLGISIVGCSYKKWRQNTDYQKTYHRRLFADNPFLHGNNRPSPLVITNSHHILACCCVCKSIRDPHGNWHHLETYLQNRYRLTFTHTYCFECAGEISKEIYH